tara:strand:- start:5821 stop:6402 length:582 start_codon:yes stop_codon:yes gene_type:complete
VSLISRLRAVVAGDDYLEGDLDYDFDENEDGYDPSDLNHNQKQKSSAPLSNANPFSFMGNGNSSKVVGMPGISTGSTEVNLMEPRSFDEMPRAIQALRERKTVILNLTMMDPDQAQRAVDFVAGGTFAIDGHQERVGESIFLFAPSCMNVTTSFPEEASPSSTTMKEGELEEPESIPAPEPAWGDSSLSAFSG